VTGTEDEDGRAAEETALIIVEVIGTGDWSSSVENRITDTFATNEALRSDLITWFSETREEMALADSGKRGAARRRAYERWTHRLRLALAEQRASRADLDHLRSVLENARGGVRGYGRTRGVRPGPAPDASPERLHRGPPGSDFGADDRRRGSGGSGSDFGAGDR
jgi:hypothetical protein